MPMNLVTDLNSFDIHSHITLPLIFTFFVPDILLKSTPTNKKN